MMALLDLGPMIHEAGAEIGVEYGQLITPLTSYADQGLPFAIDNGAYSGLDVRGFKRIVERQRPHRERCLFVTVPDVVCSARRTLEVFEHWRWQLVGWPLALVAQNGIENLEIPWKGIAAIFIGGDDAFKDGPDAVHVIRAAVALGKHVHIGRVNGVPRLQRFEKIMGDIPWTFDGSGICKHTHQRIDIANRNVDPQKPLFAEVA